MSNFGAQWDGDNSTEHTNSCIVEFMVDHVERNHGENSENWRCYAEQYAKSSLALKDLACNVIVFMRINHVFAEVANLVTLCIVV